MVAEDLATRLEEALARMRFRVEHGSFALVVFEEQPVAGDLAALRPPAQLVREAGETSLIVRAEALPDVLGRHPGARVERDYAWIRFETPMGWEVVGFLARVTELLARAGVPIGVVCSFHRDHLFLAAKHLERARAALRTLFPEAPPTSD